MAIRVVVLDMHKILVASPVSFTRKTDRHDITEILLKVAFNTINKTKENKNPFKTNGSKDEHRTVNVKTLIKRSTLISNQSKCLKLFSFLVDQINIPYIFFFN
jgi:hypothetical protein